MPDPFFSPEETAPGRNVDSAVERPMWGQERTAAGGLRGAGGLASGASEEGCRFEARVVGRVRGSRWGVFVVRFS